MGVDLTLMPIVPYPMGRIVAHHSLFYGRGIAEGVYKAIRDLPGIAVPLVHAHFTHQDLLEDARLSRDDYNVPLRAVRAGDILPILRDDAARDDVDARCCVAFLGQLPPDFEVALYWS